MTDLKTEQGGRWDYPQFLDEAVRPAESADIDAAANRLDVRPATVGNRTRTRRRCETTSGLAPAAALVRAGGSMAPARPVLGEPEAEGSRPKHDTA